VYSEQLLAWREASTVASALWMSIELVGEDSGLGDVIVGCKRGVGGATERQDMYQIYPGHLVMVRTRNQVTWLSTSTARKPGSGGEIYLNGVQISKFACRKLFLEPQGVVEAPDLDVSQGLQQ
jgi:hypothetical protein